MNQFLFALMSIAIFSSAGCQHSNHMEQTVKIVAHRGASRIAPENTVASTVLAFKRDADISEIDVYLSKDNRIMVIHDETTKRTSGVDLKVSETDSEELRKLDVGTLKSDMYAGEKIPFLEEIIDVIPQGKTLFIEVKCGPEIAPYLKKIVDNSKRKERIEIISFNFDALLACKKMMPSVPSYWLRSTTKDETTGQYPPYNPELIQQVVANHRMGLNLNHNGLTKEFVDAAHKAGLKVFVWTVNDLDDAKKMCKYGVDGITTDIPKTMKSEIAL